MTGFFDTNILIDFVNGVPEAQVATAPYSRRCISRITWLEVLAGVKDTPGEDIARTFLAQFEIIEVTAEVSEVTLTLRRHHVPKLKLPDALILASARLFGCRLITRNTRDFPVDSPDVQVPYRI
ncbi:type II toxin-antitoxin system VapC family toxin [Luteolibacter sp. SL250]|uniref:type II toxin-antitoxin system VapC family toxin n=1 Tax=Luteolibacter sp. SL250 TaxID=2995170 RepID=UPI0022713541|nr:type II toxin-antitoxin system VapC family toxin [Luteolibacter sp. SL250]WAC19319.1 type II toxin-antitoxin system VapC family toxin [Luteolibacter sp. SL250]